MRNLGEVREFSFGVSGADGRSWILYERETPWHPDASFEIKRRLVSSETVVVMGCPRCGGGQWEVKYGVWKIGERSGKAKLKLEWLERMGRGGKVEVQNMEEKGENLKGFWGRCFGRKRVVDENHGISEGEAWYLSSTLSVNRKRDFWSRWK